MANYPKIYNDSFTEIIANEGGYKCDKNDRGDWTSGTIGVGQLKGTKYGISAMSYPSLDIANLTLDDAKAIYYKDFWLKYKLNELPEMIAFQLFDAMINHGTTRGIKLLQRALHVTDDGKLGSTTLKVANSKDPKDIAINMLSERLKFYTTIKTFNIYGIGWTRRVAKNLLKLTEGN